MSETVVVIGNFDGVHPGHVEVLAEAQARRPDVPLVVVTFWPHPVRVLRPERAPMLLTGLPERIDLLRQTDRHDRTQRYPATVRIEPVSLRIAFGQADLVEQ